MEKKGKVRTGKEMGKEMQRKGKEIQIMSKKGVHILMCYPFSHKKPK